MMQPRPITFVDYLYIAGVILFTVYGQVVLKWQMNRAGPLPDAWTDKSAALLRLLLNPWVLSCIAAGALAMLSWMAALTRFQLSYAYPFVSVSFALMLLLSAALFGESITPFKAAGVALIILGVAVGARG
ncbi:MAG TPA: EamA family transporter [Gemmatimonadaceae bacterium]